MLTLGRAGERKGSKGSWEEPALRIVDAGSSPEEKHVQVLWDIGREVAQLGIIKSNWHGTWSWEKNSLGE